MPTLRTVLSGFGIVAVLGLVYSQVLDSEGQTASTAVPLSGDCAQVNPDVIGGVKRSKNGLGSGPCLAAEDWLKSEVQNCINMKRGKCDVGFVGSTYTEDMRFETVGPITVTSCAKKITSSQLFSCAKWKPEVAPSPPIPVPAPPIPYYPLPPFEPPVKSFPPDFPCASVTDTAICGNNPNCPRGLSCGIKINANGVRSCGCVTSQTTPAPAPTPSTPVGPCGQLPKPQCSGGSCPTGSICMSNTNALTAYCGCVGSNSAPQPPVATPTPVGRTCAGSFCRTRPPLQGKKARSLVHPLPHGAR